MRYLLFLLILSTLFTFCDSPSNDPSKDEFDIVIYGGTSAAVIAAVQAKKMDHSVAIVCPEQQLGGMTAGGLGWTDAGKQHVIGGLSRNFYERIYQKYLDSTRWKYESRNSYGNYGQGGKAIDQETKTMWTFEPYVAAEVYEDLIKEYQIPVFRNEWLERKNGIEKENGKIISITTLSAKVFKAKMFIDAGYEGDLMALAGVSFKVGRESNDTYGETLNGVQTVKTVKHQFIYPVDPYVIPGDPASGLLARISAEKPLEDGSEDHRLQAYNYRMCLTQVPENRIPFFRPDHYDSTQYELMLRVLESGWNEVFRKFDPIPNKKTDTNNHGPFSTDNIGMNYDYPTASYERRKEILKEHEDYQKGWLYFLANDPRVPKEVQSKMAKWGYAKDEFVGNGHWPHQIYVREARRMIGDMVITENHLRRIKPTPRSIGMGSYNMDSHNVMRYVDENGHVKNEGDIQVNPGGPYPIDYGAIIPKQEECRNLLVPVAVSASHISYGSIRMEPVFMILGQSAATAASMAISENIDIQELEYQKLKTRLLEDGQILDSE